MCLKYWWDVYLTHYLLFLKPFYNALLVISQIRHASVDRLLDRLTDLRFLSIDFLNTFLLTYRVFTTGETVLNALRRVYK